MFRASEQIAMWAACAALACLTTGCKVEEDAGLDGGLGGESGAGGESAGGSGGGAGGETAGGGSATGGAHEGTNPMPQEEIDALVAAHNAARSGPLNPMPDPALPSVTWDPVLADVAYNYASSCQGADRVLIDHNPSATDDYRALGGMDYVGENIWANSAVSYVAAEVVGSWMSEGPDYNYADNTSSGTTGHYTQVVWRTSTKIGCAFVNCAEFEYPGVVLCNYAPGGNDGSRPY